MSLFTERNTHINLSGEDMIQIAEKIGTWDKMWEAIGYLSTWNMSFSDVTIYRDGDTDLVAVYRDRDTANGDRKYVIGAVWHETHYGFHS